MILPDHVRAFLTENHRGVVTTFRKSGAAQVSVVSCGLYGDGVAFTTTADRAKIPNLRRDPRCTLLVSQSDWRGYVTLEGHAQLLSPENTDAEELRLALRGVYRVTGGGEHPDWDEYDQAMRDQRRSAVVVVPEHIYGNKI
ncbi:MAG: PPOX class F420-dependent oxidoreductase [Chloroflexi bacterium]|nr:PPOX class F420-dependent oxidoreductase [Chloroflexota bacterium]MCZ6789805.1 PPOX class F420-dependent oxidoreductase [Chloroflexota bacterium]